MLVNHFRVTPSLILPVRTYAPHLGRERHCKGSRDGAVVRAICELSLLLVLALLRGFFSGFSAFPPSTKPTPPNSNSISIEDVNELEFGDFGRKIIDTRLGQFLQLPKTRVILASRDYPCLLHPFWNQWWSCNLIGSQQCSLFTNRTIFATTKQNNESDFKVCLK